MKPCIGDDGGQLWWFSGATTQIKHKVLELCFEAPLEELQKGKQFVPLLLRNCSMEKFNVQSWSFVQGPLPKDYDDIPGDYIYLG